MLSSNLWQTIGPCSIVFNTRVGHWTHCSVHYYRRVNTMRSRWHLLSHRCQLKTNEISRIIKKPCIRICYIHWLNCCFDGKNSGGLLWVYKVFDSRGARPIWVETHTILMNAFILMYMNIFLMYFEWKINFELNWIEKKTQL